MKYLSILAGTTASFLLLTNQPSALAQQVNSQQQSPSAASESKAAEISNKEIQRFAKAFQAVQTIRDQSREKMKQAIKEQGLTIQEYNQLFREQQQSNSNNSDTSNLSQEKQQKFQKADARIDEIEQETQAEIEQAITEKGLEVERFEAILNQVRNNPELQQRVQDRLQN